MGLHSFKVSVGAATSSVGNQRLPMENATTLIDIFQDEDPVTMALVYKPELVCKDAQRGEPTKGQNTA